MPADRPEAIVATTTRPRVPRPLPLLLILALPMLLALGACRVERPAPLTRLPAAAPIGWEAAAMESASLQGQIAQPLSLQTTVMRWLAWMALFTGLGLALIWIVRQNGRRRRFGFFILGLFLITWVPPFSYVPDPLGAVQALTGNYHHDPRLPFANRFVVAGEPSQALRPYLDRLVGLTGPAPLDPDSPLARYDFVEVALQPAGQDQISVHVRFIYEDGSRHTYPLPLHHAQSTLGIYRCCWYYDGDARSDTAQTPGQLWAR